MGRHRGPRDAVDGVGVVQAAASVVLVAPAIAAALPRVRLPECSRHVRVARRRRLPKEQSPKTRIEQAVPPHLRPFANLALYGMGAFIWGVGGLPAVGFTNNTTSAVVPGSGWTGLSSDPGQQGSSGTSTAKAIARWLVSPWLTIPTGSDFYFGVAAFHETGIWKVEISIDEGSWFPATTWSLNPRTGCYEYLFRVNSTSFATDGLHKARARVYPNDGTCVVLQDDIIQGVTDQDGEYDWEFYTNNGGTLTRITRYAKASTGSDSNDGLTTATPVQTLARAAALLSGASGLAGGTIALLDSGSSTFTVTDIDLSTIGAWTRITPNTGVDRTNCKIVSGGAGMRVRRLWFDNCVVEGGINSGAGPGLANYHVRFTDCLLDGLNKATNNNFATAEFGGQWYETCTRTRTDRGIISAQLVLGCTLTQLSSQAFNSSQCVVKCTVDSIDRAGDTGKHPDVIFYQGGQCSKNLIFLANTILNADGADGAQGVFAQNAAMDRVAIVANLFESGNSDWQVNSAHMVVAHNTFPGGAWTWNSPGGALTLSSLKFFGNVFNQMSPVDVTVPTTRFDRNHFVTGTTFGSNVTTGAAGFNSTATDDYRPSVSSALRNILSSSQYLYPADAGMLAWAATDALGGKVQV